MIPLRIADCGLRIEKMNTREENRDQENRPELSRRQRSGTKNPQSNSAHRADRNPQSGYALILVIGTLTVMLIVITGLLPTVAQKMKRERETEMLFRGRQIVEAIARYQFLVAQRIGRPPAGPVVTVAPLWPRSLEQLVEGINLPGSTRKVRLLRPWALKDPMNNNGPWRPVSYGDPALRDYLQAYFKYLRRTVPPEIQIKYLGVRIDAGEKIEDRASPIGEPLGGNPPSAIRHPPSAIRGASDQRGSDPRDQLTSEGATHATSDQIIYGVVSQSEEQPIRDYYELERYDQWVFAYIPELQQVMATGEEQIQMLTREIIFPSDPLVWRVNPYAGRGMGGIGGRMAPISKPQGQDRPPSVP